MPKAKASLHDLLYDLKRIEEHREKLTEQKIRKIYKSLMKDLAAFLGDTYTKYSDADGRLYWTYLDEKRSRARFLEEVTKKVDGISPDLKHEILEMVDRTYEECYKGMKQAVQKARDAEQLADVMTDSMVRPEIVQRAVSNNISRLTLPSVLEKNRQEVTYQIQQILNIGLMNGDRYDTMAKKITERLDVSYNKAVNIARTESHRNTEAGLMDSAQDIAQGLEGSDLVYTATWRTMKDERVRPNQLRRTKKGWKRTTSKNGANHVKMEGVTIRVGDKFKLESGVYAKCPGSSGEARHDCRCRCFLEYDLLTEEEFQTLSSKQVNGFINKKSVSDYTRALMNENKISNCNLERTTDVKRFHDAVVAAKKTNPNGACVDTHSIEELKTFKLYLSKNNMAGVAVKPDGDITAVFKNSNWRQRRVVNDLIITARANGGVKMDCYGQDLVNMYEKCGYVPVARIPFNADYVDDPYFINHPVDVYALMRNSENLKTVIKNNSTESYHLSTQNELDNLPTFEDYDEALKYRDNLLAKQTEK